MAIWWVKRDLRLFDNPALTQALAHNSIRIYLPQKQLIDHDPQCNFVRSMIPELRSLKTVQILALNHENVAPEYTKPIIDFKQEPKIMKDALYGISKSVSGMQNCFKGFFGI